MAAATHLERHLALRTALEGWGYTGAVSERFPLWSPSEGRARLHADYVAFTNVQQRDMSTSAVVAQVTDADADVRRRWLPAAAALGAPAFLAALPDRLVLWQTATDLAEAAELTSAPVSAPSDLVGRTSALSQEVIAKAKAQGFHPALFPLGLEVLNDSRHRAQTYLTEQVEQALVRVLGLNARHDQTARLVIGALAVLMIRDKSESPGLEDAPPGVLIDVALQRFPEYFEWLGQLTEKEGIAFSTLIRDLGTNINFAGLEPAMVSDVYEQALVTRLVRRQRGTYYTPPGLANQIMNVIPFESLDPSRRMVLDPACGSGTMLLAAANRLNQLEPTLASSASWHRYLRSHLRGYDDDPLATEMTKLCLLMNAMPIGNSWQVDTVDTLSLQLTPEERPTIIASNPPWEFHREGEQTAEKANVFLSWMLANLAEGGFLASVVPLSWINKPHSRASREVLLQNAELLEVWRLPAEVFSSTASTIAPAVIIAHKHGQANYRRHITLVKTVRDRSAETFLATGCADETYLVEPSYTGSRLIYGPLTRELDGLEDFTTIGNVAHVYTGRPQKRGRPERSRSDATHFELGSLRELKPFGRPNLADLRPVRYPEDYGHARQTDERVRAHKVVVAGKHFSTRNPWRLDLGYDDYGLSLRESFFSVIPNPESPIWSSLTEWERLCIVMAALGSGLASSWIDEHEPTRNISIRFLKEFRLPTDSDRLLRLAEVGDAMVNAVASQRIERIEQCALALETTVNDAYRLSAKARDLIAVRLAGAPAFEGVVRYPAESPRATPTEDIDIPSFGHVLEADENGVVLWISGVTELLSGVRLSPPLQIPGWLCRKGSDFTVRGSFENLGSARFGFHRADWLSDEELTRPSDIERLREFA
jgi:N-6 DNA Methylase